MELTDVETQSPKIAEFISSRSFDRLIRTQPETLSKVPDQIVAAPLGKTTIKVDDGNVQARLEVTKSDHAIDVEISYVSFAVQNNTVLGLAKSFFALGKRNRSLNMLFPRLIAGIASGLEKLIVIDPTLHSISISGSYVVNLELTKKLKELGFQPNSPRGNKIFLNALRGEGFFASVIHTIASFSGVVEALPDYVYLPLKVAKNVTILIAGYRYRDLGRDWRIELQVRRVESDET